MMRLRIIGFIIFQTFVLGQAGLSGTRAQTRKARNNVKEILEASETRYGDYPERDYGSGSNGITRKDFDIPITFKAPHYEAHDYWRNEHDYHNRRTFFEGFPHGKTTPFPDFYQFMTSIFGGGAESQESHYNRHRATPSYPFETPIVFNPTEPNYIPSPKPIRASVIKLETITRSPIYPPFEYETTPNYYPHVLNHVLKDNSKLQQSVGYRPDEPIPPFKPLPVLPKPEFIPPTTTKPTYPAYTFEHIQSPYAFNNTRGPFKDNKTDYKYPESVQDKLPHLHEGDVEIPYISEKPHIFDIHSRETSRERQFGYTSDFFPPSETTTNILIDIRSLNPPRTNADRRERPNPSKDATPIKSFPGAVEKVKRPTFKYTKKLTAQLDKSSVERVTNLTVEGFSKADNDGDLRKNFNFLNVRELINYEMDKLGNVSHSYNKQSTPNTTMRPVNLNDEFSLDARILKDTNWDGLTVPPTQAVTENQESTTLFVRPLEPKPKTKTAFWEIPEGPAPTGPEQTTIPPNSSEEPTEATTEQNSIRTTTEFTLWPTATEPTESSGQDDTEEPTTRTSAQRRVESVLGGESVKQVTEIPDWIVSTTPAEKTTPKRRYSRRPKVINFTPYPTPEELQRKLINRNPFPKRSKPNITIAFGNKNIFKERHSLRKEEFMKFSDEDLGKRRKTGKRRQVYKRVRVSTSERPIEDS